MPADTGVIEKGAHVGRMREGLPPVSPLLVRPPQDLGSVLGELQRVQSQRQALETQHGKYEVMRTERFLEEQQGELEVARAYFGSDGDSDAPTVSKEVDERLAASKRKDTHGVHTVYEIGGKEVNDPQQARRLVTEMVMVRRLRLVTRIRDEIDPGGKATTKEFAAISDPKAKGQLYAAELILQVLHPFKVADETGVARETYGAVAEFDAQPTEVASLDDAGARGKIDKAAKLLPEADTISTLVATEAGGIYGKPLTSSERQSATCLAKAGAETAERVINAATGRRPTDVPLALERPDPRTPSLRIPIDVSRMAVGALNGIRVSRADKIVGNHATESEKRLIADYQSDTVTNERFASEVGRALAEEASLREEIKKQGIDVAGKIAGESWHNLLPWRRWAREGLPAIQGGLVVFQEQSTEGARVTGLIPTPEAFRALLEERGVREAIVRLYPLVQGGRLAFGASSAVYGSENPALDNQAMRPLANLSGAERAALGITGSPEETIAFEVLRTWFVHPRPELKIAWDIQKGPFDSLRRWYFADKWPHFAEQFARVMERVNKGRGRGGTAIPLDRLFSIGDAWTMTGRDINELLTDWDSVRVDGAVVELGRFYDSAKKATETANALETLFKAGVTLENVYKFLYESEKFKHLSTGERGEILKAFYEEGYDNFLKDLRLELQLKEGLKPGRRAEVVGQIDSLVQKCLMTESQANRLKAEVNKMREKGDGIRLKERTYRYLHHYPNLLTLATSLVGGVLSKIGLEEVGQPLSFWGKKIAGWSFYGAVVGGGAFFAINTWSLVAEMPIHLALGKAFLQTFVTAAWPAQWTVGGLLSSSGLWISAATWGITFLGRALRRINISYDDYHREDEAISAAKKKK